MLGPNAKPLHHAAAHHAPAQRAHHFPEFYPLGIYAAAGRLISGKQLFARAKAADRLVDLAKAPGIDADPPQILHGIAGMRELPVQHRTHAIGADDKIAVAKIAVHQRYLLGGTGVAVAQPAQHQFEHWPRPVKAAVVAFELGNLLRRRHAAKFWQFRQRQSVDAGRDLAELARQQRTSFAELLVAQNFARDGFAFHALHDEAGAEPVVRLQHMQHARRRHAGVMGKLHQLSFGSEPGRPQGAAPNPGGARRRIAPKTPSGCTISNDQVSWLAPPESFAAPVTPVAPGHHEATQRPSSAPSFALELRGTLFEERGDAFLEIFRRTGPALHLLLEIELILE